MLTRERRVSNKAPLKSPNRLATTGFALFELEGRTHLHEMTHTLVDTATGKLKADLVVRNVSLVNVNSEEIVEGQDVAIKKDRIAFVGQAEHTIGPTTRVINAGGKYLVPGFIDGHMHIESAMVTATEFARAVLPHGSTTVFVDPHEIANVLGLSGVRFFLDESKNLPLKVLVTFPSCVPAAPGFETSAGNIGTPEVEEALKWNGVVALGEMMNYPGVISSDPQVHGELAATLKAGRVVEGHAVNLLDRDLVAYVAAGITSCHESTKKIQAVQKLRLGMYVMLRESSAWRDVADTVRAITEEKLNSRHICLVTDDREPHSILTEGHVDHVVRRAIEEGVDPIKAIQMATINVAEHYECSRNLGSIAPARIADMIILDRLSTVSIRTVIANGQVVSQDGKLTANIAPPKLPEFIRKSIILKAAPTLNDLIVKSKTSQRTVRIRAIGIIPASAYTDYLEVEAHSKDGRVYSNVDEDVLKIAVFERHRGTGNKSVGFVKGFGISEGAVASTVAHDSHNLVVAGASDEDMISAVNELVHSQGGMVVVRKGRTLAHVPLPIAGLMSDRPVEAVAQGVERLKEAWVTLGCPLPSPYMNLALTTLSVIPKLRITDKGLLDTVNFKFVSPIIE